MFGEKDPDTTTFSIPRSLLSFLTLAYEYEP